MAGGGDASALTPVKDTGDTARGDDRFLKSVSKVPPRVRRCCRLRAWCCGGLVVKEPGEATLMSVLSTTARQLYPYQRGVTCVAAGCTCALLTLADCERYD